MGPWLKVSSNRLVKWGIEPGTPGLQGKQFTHYTTVAVGSVIYFQELMVELIIIYMYSGVPEAL